MKILVDARPLCIPAPGGVTRVTRQFLDDLFAIDQQNAYLLGTTGSVRPTLPWPVTPERDHRHRLIPNKIVSALSATRLISFEHWFYPSKADVLFLPNLGHVGIPSVPYVLLIHDLTFLIEPRWYPWRGRVWHKIVHATELIKRAKSVLVISEHTKRDLIRLLEIPASQIYVLPFKPKLHGEAQELPTELQEKLFLLTLGGRDKRKNAGASIRAWQELRKEKKYQDLELVIVGGAHKLIQASLVPGIHVFNHPTDNEVATLYKNAAVFLYPSWAEGYGIPLHEAARFGTPCIGGSGSALEETAPEGTLLIPPEKPHLLAEAIRLQLETPQRTCLGPTSTTPSSCANELLYCLSLATR